ncbi:MAG: hypothetical protein Q9196_003532 [Gyalolechia fulgens]
MRSYTSVRSANTHISSPSVSAAYSAIPAAASPQSLQVSSTHLHLDPASHFTAPPALTSFTSTPLSLHRSTPTHSTQQLTRAPLTRQNLKRLDDPSPKHSQRTSGMSSKASTTTDPAEVWRQLRRNHIYDNDPQGAKLGEKIIANAEGIINNFRNSVMQDEELDDVADVLKEYGTAGETTFLIHLWEVLLKKNRQKRIDLTDEEWITTAWAKDGLRSNWQEHFAANWVPQLEDHGDPRLIWLYENAPKVKTPWPDITYGYTQRSCDYIIQEIAERFNAILCKEMHFPWWFVEAKGAGQPYAAAGHQKARAGATATRQLREVDRLMAAEITKYKKASKQSAQSTGETSGNKVSAKEKGVKRKYPYADPSAVVFSLSVSPDLAHLSVHFAEQRDAKTTHYHMHTIGSYLFHEKGRRSRLAQTHQ